MIRADLNSVKNKRGTDMIYEEFSRILKSEMVPALGCTDPIGIAFCAAVARKYSRGDIIKIEAWLSKNLIKNVMAVIIPGSNGMCGAGIAAALGAVCGDPDKKLEVLEGISSEQVNEAAVLEDAGKITIYVADENIPLYMKLRLFTEQDEVTVIIKDGYTNVTEISVNGCCILKESESGAADDSLRYDLLDLGNIMDFADNAPLDSMGVVAEAIEMNRDLAQAGLNEGLGTRIGMLIKESGREKVHSDITSNAMLWASAGVDARMAGCQLPAMSNTGSGNQGIVSTMPVFGASKALGKSDEEMIRAAALSCLITIYIKHRIGKLTSVCGCTIAGTGSACGIVYLQGGNKQDMVNVMKNMFGNVAGMICDGAKISCALKTATCINAACMSAELALQGFGLDVTNGITGDSEKQCIDNFVRTSKEGLEKMDEVVLDIIMNK